MMDLGNLVAVAIVFGQFVTAALYFGGFTFSRERGGDRHL
jgi:hypothetical protein